MAKKSPLGTEKPHWNIVDFIDKEGDKSSAEKKTKAASKNDIYADFSLGDEDTKYLRMAEISMALNYGDDPKIKKDAFMSKDPQPPRGPLMANTLSPIEALPEDINILLNEMRFERVGEKIYVTMIAIDPEHPERNIVESIPAYGDPLGGYAYTAESDNYLVSCCGFMPVGIIPMAFRLSMPGYSGKQLVPLPASLIYKYASPAQRKSMLTLQEQFSGCSFQYIQSLSRL